MKSITLTYKNQTAFPLKEVNRRLKNFQEVYNYHITLKESFESCVVKSAVTSFKNLNPEILDERNRELSSDVECCDQLTVDGLKDQLRAQDEGLDELHGLIKQSKGLNKAMSTEVNNHKAKLEEINTNLDVVNSKVTNTNKKLKEYTDTSSNFWLLVTIGVELLILVLVISLL